MEIVEFGAGTNELKWFVRLDTGSPDNIRWDWEVGGPPVRELQPVRRPQSKALSKHVPVIAHCMTTDSSLHLESAAEFELALLCDRDPDVEWIVSQPIMIRFSRKKYHVVDLLTIKSDGAVTTWDVRPSARQNADFHEKSRLSRDAFSSVGWNYEVHSGLSEIASLNLRWLACARRPPEWIGPARKSLSTFLQSDRMIGDIVDGDSDGYLTSAFWHMVWTNEIALDLEARWNTHTTVTWKGQR